VTSTSEDEQLPRKRTAQYETLPRKRGKRRARLDLMLAYTRITDSWLRMRGRTSAWHRLDDPRVRRTAAKDRRREGVPVQLQDQALWDAVDTMRRHLQSAMANTHLRAKVFVQLDGAKRRYAFWILHRYARIGAVWRGEAPDPPPPPGAKWKGMAIAVHQRKAVVRFVRRTLHQALGKPPRVHRRRSFALHRTRYRVLEHNGQQYVSVVTLTARKRCRLPLRGRGGVPGNGRVVLRPDCGSVLVHVPSAVRVAGEAPSGAATRLDAGVRAVLATSTGEKLGVGYGTLRERLSEERTETGKARNKRLQLAKKAEERGDAAKASRIRRHNLGHKKRRVKRERGQAASVMPPQVGRTATPGEAAGMISMMRSPTALTCDGQNLPGIPAGTPGRA